MDSELKDELYREAMQLLDEADELLAKARARHEEFVLIHKIADRFFSEHEIDRDKATLLAAVAVEEMRDQKAS